MWFKLKLRTRIYLLLGGLSLITLLGGWVMIWYTHRIDGLLNLVADKYLATYQAAEALENALVNQRGFVSYYLLDADPDWLRQLGEYRQLWITRLAEAKASADTPEQQQAIGRIESEYQNYILGKDQVIAYYRAGDRVAGEKLHRQVRERFYAILKLCEQYKKLHTGIIRFSRQQAQEQGVKLRAIAVAAILLTASLALLLAILLVRQILLPVNRLILETGRSGPDQSENPVAILSRSVHDLIEDADQVQEELEKSREHLIQADRLALVGKLAAGMAHSIRNPFTSVKMRLFSLSRSLDLSATQKEDFDVITEEIRHVDTIVQNFLEFSRPPKLKMQATSPSTVVDMAIQLLVHRLKSYDVEVKLHRPKPLPEVMADPEQLKEVVVNLMVNACEAMEHGGMIEIEEQMDMADLNRPTAVIRIRDNGPGMPEAVREKIFQPFYTTKDEGTGLGLSIALRIIEEHKGQMEVSSTEGQGTTFSIRLPLTEYIRSQD
jgi:signal transduction histidine kinase